MIHKNILGHFYFPFWTQLFKLDERPMGSFNNSKERNSNHEIFNNEDAWNYFDEEFKPPAESE